MYWYCDGGGVNKIVVSIFHATHLFTNEFIESAFLISSGILFYIIVTEYEILFLNRLMFGFGIIKFLLDTDRKLEVVLLALVFRIWNKSIRYFGAILFAVLYIVLAFCKNTLSSNDSIFRRFLASSKLVHSLPSISLQARLCSLFILLISLFEEFPNTMLQ